MKVGACVMGIGVMVGDHLDVTHTIDLDEKKDEKMLLDIQKAITKHHKLKDLLKRAKHVEDKND